MVLEEKNRVFKTFDELKIAIANYEIEKKVSFYIKSSTSVEYYNSRLKKEKYKLPSALVYQRILYHCSKFGAPRQVTATPTTHSFERLVIYISISIFIISIQHQVKTCC